MYRRVPPKPTKPDPLAVLRRLTPRDRLLLSWLAEHYLLSTDQIARALFTSPATARMRLTILYRIGALTRFSFSDPDGGTPPFLYTLGPVGLHLHPNAWSDPDNPKAKPPRSHIDRARRIARSQKREHTLGVNQFFVDLHAHTRTDPQARLARWWSEHHATDAYASARIFPDGHGIWQHGQHSVGFFLEHDRGTEPLRKVLAKLRGYERLTEFGPRYPVLFWVPNPARERSLQDALAGVPTLTPVATAVHSPDPAGPVWTLTSDPGQRLRLHELPSDHGPAAGTNPNRYNDVRDLTGDAL
ncbi:replication-relaxation family protein [Phytohabitans kaempferiae]|uniref:Replication-relaxation family protein n=1 Tax=Phytohabitans kaempferiae TaxID=1620943 RepID=A0ABV6MBZ5_9ACTN